MSYTPRLVPVGTLGGLGQDVRDTSSLVPTECRNMAVYHMPPAEIAANQVLVQVFPFVRKHAEKMPAVLAQILGANGEGGEALRLDVADAGASYSFVGGGWIADALSNPSTTRGYLWLALAPAAKRTAGAMRNDAKRLLARALRMENLPVHAPGAPSSNPTDSTVDMGATWGSVATGESDDALREAVYTAMGGAAQFGSFVRLVPSSARAAAAGGRISNAFAAEAERMSRAVQAVQGIAATESLVKQHVARALGMSSESQAEAAGLLNQAQAQVNTAVGAIQGAVQNAPVFVQLAATEREKILREVRLAILNSAEIDIARGSPFEPAREYLRCSLLKASKQMVDAQLATTDGAITSAASSAQWLLDNGPAIDDAIRRLEALRTLIAKAFEQLPLGFWLRKRWGLPTWGWGVVGTGAFVAGAFGVRRHLKKRRAS